MPSAHRLTRREFVGGGVAALAASLPTSSSSAAAARPAVTLENRYVQLSMAADGRSVRLVDRQSGKDYAAPGGQQPFARVRQGGKEYAASAVKWDGDRLAFEFAESAVRAVVRTETRDRYLTFEVVSASGDQIEELTFIDIALTLRGAGHEPFAACALALNLRTNVAELPGPGSRLRAICYPELGFVGAKVAVVACPQAELRNLLQEVVAAAPDLPHSRLGGPWALDQAINRGSYLFNFDGVTDRNVDGWIKLAKSMGMTQIDFHGGQSFRFGDCRPNPALYPEGRASLKAVIDRLHGAGIAAGLHTYAFFIAKDCPWVTPKPDSRLAADATFSLAESVTPQATSIPVLETTAKMSSVTGFFVRNSVTVRIDDELIVYRGIRKEPPFAFIDCQRGAHGTKPATHDKGAKAHHLKECFGLFVPDPRSTLLAEVAGGTADTFNECGFDMIYLDALDGSDVLDPFRGGAFAWHYGTRFVYEICNRLKKPALMEMSTFHHHLWCVLSRYCAWDHPNRSHKKFIDIHCADNESSRRMMLPGELGWWALKNWTGPQGEPTFADDMEYLLAKCLATDTGFALMGIDPSNVAGIPALPRLAGMIKRYEDLRHSGKVPETIKTKLRAPGAEHALIGDVSGPWQFRPVDFVKHKVESSEPWSSSWQVNNRFDPQPPRLRVQVLMAAGPYEAADNITLADFQTPADAASRKAQNGVTIDLRPSQALLKAATISGLLTASSTHPTPRSAWAGLEKRFSPAVNLSRHQALGLWVHGDGQGELLNIQLRSPEHITGGIGDHYIPIDFAGWRYFELIEPEGARYSDYIWPYGGLYSIYRESVEFAHIEALGIWYNNLPKDKPVSCFLSPIKALPLIKAVLVNPVMTVGSATIKFPVKIESGCYLEFSAMNDCKLYGSQGQLLQEVNPQGEVPVLQSGDNRCEFGSGTTPGLSPRACVTVISQGEPLLP